MKISRRDLGALLAGSVIAGTIPEISAAFPDKPIKFILSHPPGGSADVIARLMLPKLQASLGQPVIIENKAGAGGVIAMDAVAKAKPDGYTIGFGAAGALALSIARHDPVGYDPQKDFTPILAISGQPFILAAPASFSGRSLQDVIELTKQKRLTLGHGGAVMELVAAMLNEAIGDRMDLVPYRGNSAVVNDLLGGHIDLGVIDIPSGQSAFESGLIKPLAISTNERFAGLPKVPTIAESGVPGFDVLGWLGIVAPAGLTPETADRLEHAFVDAVSDPELLARFKTFGSIKLSARRAKFGEMIANDIQRYSAIVEKYGLAKK